MWQHLAVALVEAQVKPDLPVRLSLARVPMKCRLYPDVLDSLGSNFTPPWRTWAPFPSARASPSMSAAFQQRGGHGCISSTHQNAASCGKTMVSMVSPVPATEHLHFGP